MILIIHQQVPGEPDESESTEDVSDPHMKPGPQGDRSSAMPSTSPPQAHQHHYDNPMIPAGMDPLEDLPQSSSVKSQLAAALVARGSTMDITTLTSSRKRKQSSPQPCRDIMEAAGAGERVVAGEGGELGILAKVAKPGPSSSQLETKNSKL